MDARMILQVNGLGKGQTTNTALVILFSAVQLLVRPQAGVARERAAANVAVERLFGRRHFRVFVTADEDDTGPIAFVTLGDGGHVSLLYRIVAGLVRRAGALLELRLLQHMVLMLWRACLTESQILCVDYVHAVAGVHLEFDVTVRRDEDLCLPLRHDGCVVGADAVLASNQFRSLSLRILLDGAAAGDTLQGFVDFHVLLLLLMVLFCNIAKIGIFIDCIRLIKFEIIVQFRDKLTGMVLLLLMMLLLMVVLLLMLSEIQESYQSSKSSKVKITLKDKLLTSQTKQTCWWWCCWWWSLCWTCCSIASAETIWICAKFCPFSFTKLLPWTKFCPPCCVTTVICWSLVASVPSCVWMRLWWFNSVKCENIMPQTSHLKLMFEMVFVIGLLTTWIRPLLSTVAMPATVDAAIRLQSLLKRTK